MTSHLTGRAHVAHPDPALPWRIGVVPRCREYAAMKELAAITPTPALQEELLTNPLFAGLPAVRDGRVTLLDGEGAKASNGATSLDVLWSVEQRRAALERVNELG